MTSLMDSVELGSLVDLYTNSGRPYGFELNNEQRRKFVDALTAASVSDFLDMYSIFGFPEARRTLSCVPLKKVLQVVEPEYFNNNEMGDGSVDDLLYEKQNLLAECIISRFYNNLVVTGDDGKKKVDMSKHDAFVKHLTRVVAPEIRMNALFTLGENDPDVANYFLATSFNPRNDTNLKDWSHD